MIRVQIVAHVRLYREGLTQVLSQGFPLLIVGTSHGAAQALEDALRLAPDVVLIDMATPGAPGFVQAITQQLGGPRIVGFALSDSQEEIIECVKMGISGYVSTDGSIDDVVTTIESVARDEMICPPRITAALARCVTDLAAAHPPPVTPLTYREREVIDLIDRGWSNKQIAQQLHITIATVKNHIHHVLKKLGVRTRGEVAAARDSLRPSSSRRPHLT